MGFLFYSLIKNHIIVMSSKGAPVPESLLKKRKATEKVLANRAAHAQASLKRSRASRKVIFKRAEKYAKEYRAQERSLIRLRRSAKESNNFFVEPEAKLAFVVRIRGINGVHPKVKKILRLLRLRQINNGVFVRLNAATKQMLLRVENYVAFGYPNLKSVRELIYKRGFASLNKQRIAITDNQVIENALGKHGIICMEDLVHEIYTVGPHFKEANRFLWPFMLNSPNGGFNKKTNHFNEGGDAGNREHHINRLVRRMN